MQKSTVVDLVKALRALSEVQYRMANEAMNPNEGGPHEVYRHMKDHMATETKLRRTEMRYSSVLSGK